MPDPHPLYSLPDSVNQQTSSPHPPLGYRCHQCDTRIANRSLLNVHHLNHHQIGQGGLHPDPYKNDRNAPWVKPGGIDEQDRHVYLSNRSLILERYREGSMEAVYNFPANKTVTVEQLMGFVNEVYERQSKAFKLNLNFGYLLRHRDNGSARYFKPF